MKYTTVTQPEWANAEHTKINCRVVFDGIGEHQFTASKDDIEPHSQDIFNRAVQREFGVIVAYSQPPVILRRKTEIEMIIEVLMEKGIVTEQEIDSIRNR